jgi:hypothetical protein
MIGIICLNYIEIYYSLGFNNYECVATAAVFTKKNSRVLAINRPGPHNYNVLCIIIGSLLGDM